MSQRTPRIRQLKKQFTLLSLEEKRSYLDDSLAGLRGNPSFEAFMLALDDLRSESIRAAVRVDSVLSEGATYTALGEIRAYEDIFALIEEKISKST